MSENNDNFFENPEQENTEPEQQNSTEVNGNGVEEGTGTPATDSITDDNDLFELKQRVKGMDEEAARLIQLQSEMEQQMKSTQSPTPNFGGNFGGPPAPMSAEERMDADLRSIYVGNVDYSATAQELEAHFHGCGSINRVTILCDKFSGHPKGFAYVEFGDKDSVQTAQALDDSLFKGRQIKVTAKRTNRPGISTTDRVPRGGGGGGRGMAMGGGYGGPMRGRGRGGYGMSGGNFGMRGRGRGGYGMSGGGPARGGRGFYHYSPY